MSLLLEALRKAEEQHVDAGAAQIFSGRKSGKRARLGLLAIAVLAAAFIGALFLFGAPLLDRFLGGNASIAPPNASTPAPPAASLAAQANEPPGAAPTAEAAATAAEEREKPPANVASTPLVEPKRIPARPSSRKKNAMTETAERDAAPSAPSATSPIAAGPATVMRDPPVTWKAPARTDHRSRLEDKASLIERREVDPIALAREREQAGDLIGALTAWKEAATALPNQRDVWLGMGGAYARAGDALAAAKAYERALALDGNDADALAALAALRGASDPVGWRSRLTLAIERTPRHAGLRAALGHQLALLREWGAAAQAFGEAATIEPRAEYFANRAICLERAGRYPAAIEAWQQVLTAPAGQFDLALARERIERLKEE